MQSDALVAFGDRTSTTGNIDLDIRDLIASRQWPCQTKASLASLAEYLLPLKNVEAIMIRKLKSGEYRLYSRKVDSKTGKRKNLGTFKSREAAEKHEREVQYFKRH